MEKVTTKAMGKQNLRQRILRKVRALISILIIIKTVKKQLKKKKNQKNLLNQHGSLTPTKSLLITADSVPI